jgi:putative ABC transport system substrate-binding protein
MISRRRAIVAIGASVPALLPSVVLAQRPGIRRIGFLGIRSRSTASNPDPYYDAFVQGMREFGYVEGKNLAIEWRFGEGVYERLPALAVELVRANVEVIVTHGAPGTLAAKKATTTIPIVTASLGNPVARGFATSLSRPGGNITGLSTTVDDVTEKQVQLLKTMVPASSRVAMLRHPGSTAVLNVAQAAAEKLGMTILPVNATTAEQIELGFATMKQEGAEAVIVNSEAFYTGQRAQIARLALANRLPSMLPYREYVEAGGLMSYSPDIAELFRSAARFVDKILNGASPGDLPFEQPTRYYLVINLKTANAIGVTVPAQLLDVADDVIE